MTRPVQIHLHALDTGRKTQLTIEVPVWEGTALLPPAVVFEGAQYLRVALWMSDCAEYASAPALSLDGTIAVGVPVVPPPEHLAHHVRLAVACAYWYLASRAQADAGSHEGCEPDHCVEGACQEALEYEEEGRRFLEVLDSQEQRRALELLGRDDAEGARARLEALVMLRRINLPTRGFTVKVFGERWRDYGEVVLGPKAAFPGK